MNLGSPAEPDERGSRTPQGFEVALVTLPFGDAHTPCLAISLLQAELAAVSIPCRTFHLNLGFAERIGIPAYDAYSSDISGAALGEWIFSGCLHEGAEPDGDGYVEEVLIPLERYTLDALAGFEAHRAMAPGYLRDCLAAHDWSRFRLVGFTTTFQQNTASLAFARLLKRAHPEIRIAFGGANCEGVMGSRLLRSFPWIDFVCTGEGDDVFPELALQLAGRRPPAPIAGILRRDDVGTGMPLTHPPMVTDLDRLPYPDFSDYFERVAASPRRDALRCRITLETSRGCWWGEKHHCTFCGLNGLTMRFRSKSPERAGREIAELAARFRPFLYSRCGISFSDNILDMGYFRSLLPTLREAGLGTSLFYETKANLTRAQVRMLAESGIREIQPGIESLHSGLLRLMRKGCTGLQNLQLLRWCRRFGIIPHWNLLYGFPDEDPRWFREQAALVPRIAHLRPPEGVTPVRLDRFSPYFCEAPEHGIVNVRPARALARIYRLPEDELRDLAYHFEFDFADGREPGRYIGPLKEAVRDWKAREARAFLLGLPWRDGMVLWDGRDDASRPHRLLDAAGRALYEFCDQIRGRADIVRHAGETLGWAEPAVLARLAEWEEAGLVLREDDRFLALAVLLDEVPRPWDEGLGAPDGAATAAPRPAAAPRPVRRAGHPALELADGTLVLDRVRGRAFVLEGVAARLWATADGRPGDGTPAAERVLEGLVAAGLLERDGD